MQPKITNMATNKLPKFCVFCGEKPEKKNKEHIIPKWLIEMTGDPNRIINLGINYTSIKNKEYKPRSFPFSSYQFPACTRCNTEFSKLETQTKPIIKKILVREYINEKEIHILLNWFDKVRIGLWLGTLLLDRETAPVNPNFHIKSRMMQKDRGLFIYEANDCQKGVQFIGTNSPVFLHSPSCFALCINNFYFFNFSNDFLFSYNIGWPYPINQWYSNEDNRLRIDLSVGKERIKYPLIKYNFHPALIELYQPIKFGSIGEFISDSEELYNVDFVRNSCFDYKSGIGKVFYKENNSLFTLEEDEELCLNEDNNNSFNRHKIDKIIAKQVLNFQLFMMKNIPSLDYLSIEERKNVRNLYKSVLSMQKLFITLV